MSGPSDNTPHRQTDDQLEDVEQSAVSPPPAATPAEESAVQPAPTAESVQTSDTPSTAKTVRCALTGEEISEDEAYWAPPLVTLQDLLSTIGTTLKENPGNITNVLFAPQPDVPYSPRARDQLASRRSAEQMKFIGLFAAIVVVVGGIIWLIAGAF